MNYGAAGAVIGHEIMHGFDDQGRKIDENGAVRDWWTKEDASRFKALTRRARQAIFDPTRRRRACSSTAR